MASDLDREEMHELCDSVFNSLEIERKYARVNSKALDAIRSLVWGYKPGDKDLLKRIQLIIHDALTVGHFVDYDGPILNEEDLHK